MKESLAPGFLVASPSLACPFFNHSLVLMVEHGDEGSFGFVVNKAAGVALESVADELSLSPRAGGAESIPVMVGGPVSPNTGWILFDPASDALPSEDTVRLDDKLAVTASVDVLRRFVGGEAPERAMLLLGYAGWSPGQLEDEMQEGSWIPVDLDAELVFATARERRWEMALRALGIDPARVVGRRVASA